MDIPERNISDSVVAIMDSRGKIWGTGFIAGRELIVTCAHVIEAADSGPRQPVSVLFQTDGKIYQAEVCQEYWCPPDNEDIAILQLQECLPEDSCWIPLGDSNEVSGYPFRSFGYPRIGDFVGLHITGEIIGAVRRQPNCNMLQLQSQQLAPGTSGAPILIRNLNRIVGVLSLSYNPKGNMPFRFRDEGFATTIDTLLEVCPRLEKFVVPLQPRLPYADKTFVGRQTELTQIHNALSTNQIVLLTGTIGVGKTHLAAQYFQKNENSYSQKSCWIEWKESNPPINKLKTVIQEQKALLVIDGVEDLLSFSNILAGITNLDPTAIRSHILITTRQHDKSKPFDNKITIQAIHLNPLPQKDAVALLLKTSGRESVDEGKKNSAHAICSLLGNSPYMLEMVGNHIKQSPGLSLAEYLTRPNADDLDETEVNWAKALRLPPQQTRATTATLKLHWDALPSELPRRVLKMAALLCGEKSWVSLPRLALFTGIALTAEKSRSSLEDVLRSLLEFYLIEELDGDILRLNPLVIAFAAQQKLTKKRENARLVKAIRNVVNDLALLEAERRRAGGILLQIHGWDAIPFEQITVKEMLDYLELIRRSVENNEQRNYLIERCIQPTLDKKMSKRQRALLLRHLASVLAQAGKRKKALKTYRKADKLINKLAASKKSRPEDSKLAAYINLGIANLSERKEAIVLFHKALRAAQAYGKDPILEASILKELSYNYIQLHEWKQAEIAYQTAIEVLQEYLVTYAMVLETASHFFEKRGENNQGKASKQTQTPMDYEEAYRIVREEIELLERSSLTETVSFVYAHMNAADNALKSKPYTNHELSDPIQTACDHWHTALPIALRLDMNDDADEIKNLLEKHQP